MNLKIKKSLYALIMSGALFSITGCSISNTINKKIEIESDKDKELFNNIGLDDNIINNSDFIDTINIIKSAGYTLKKENILDNDVISIYDTDNSIKGVINKGLTDDQISINCSFDNDKYYDSYLINYIYNISDKGDTTFSYITCEYYYTDKENVFNTYTKCYIDNSLQIQSIQLEQLDGEVFYISLNKKENTFTLNDDIFYINKKDFDIFFNKMKECKKNSNLKEYIDYIINNDKTANNESNYLIKVR